MKIGGNFDRRKLRRLVIDVDGVILQFAGTFADWSNSQDNKLPQLPPNLGKWGFGQSDKVTADISKEIGRFMALDNILPLMDKDIPELIKLLKETYEIWLVTALPEKYKKTREKNLKHHGIEYDNILYVDGSKLEIIEQIAPLAVIEDKPQTILDLAKSEKFTGPVLCPTYWNYIKNMQKDNPEIKRIKYYDNWKQLIKKLK